MDFRVQEKYTSKGRELLFFCEFADNSNGTTFQTPTIFLKSITNLHIACKWIYFSTLFKRFPFGSLNNFFVSLPPLIYKHQELVFQNDPTGLILLHWIKS